MANEIKVVVLDDDTEAFLRLLKEFKAAGHDLSWEQVAWISCDGMDPLNLDPTE